MNAIELSEWLIAFTQDASDYEEKWIKDSAEILISQQSQIKEKDVCLKLLGAEIEALKAKLNKYHLKEDLDKNINLIYGKEFIK
ncbi:hypothetical protein UFOVP14_61 [uncultured Caudovirales phage]|uniref:Uncharacterized protein n=1 Tax=uncultured Caudovirales phage TaxID=2100421 RepID=A0A6J5KJF1_9CAUD|nr:hypothetical protein UFOVP14_61 [uncultured Caudovirales phage]